MTIAVCPQCGEAVQVPTANGSVRVACPLCQSEYSLDEVLSKLPPMLQVLDPAPPSFAPVDVMARTTGVSPETYPDTSEATYELAEEPLVVSTEPEPSRAASFDFDGEPTAGARFASRQIRSTTALRPKARRRSVASELIKIVLGGIAGLLIAQAILWWLPKGWRRDPFGLAPKLPTQLAFLVPTDLRGLGATGGAPSTDQGAPSPEALSSEASTDPDAAMPIEADRLALPDLDDPGAKGERNEEPADISVDDMLGVRDAPTYTSRELEEALTQVQAAMDDWNDRHNTAPQADRMKRATRLFEGLYPLAWMATFADPVAEQSSAVRAKIDTVLLAMAAVPENIDLVRRAALKWLRAENRPLRGILLSGTVTSIRPQGLYVTTTLELPGEKKPVVTVVNRFDPSTGPQRSYQVGDLILLFGAIMTDPSLDIIGYSGNESTVIWSGPWIVQSPQGVGSF